MGYFEVALLSLRDECDPLNCEARVITMVLHGPPVAPPSGLRSSGNVLR